MDYIQDNFWDDCSNNNKHLNKRFQKNNTSICKNLNKTQNSTINSSTISYKNKNSRNCTLYINSKGFKKSKLLPKIFANLYLDALNRNHKLNNKSNLSSINKKNIEDLEECTFHPKITKLKNNSQLKLSVDKYCENSLLVRFKIFNKKKEDFKFKGKIRKRINSEEKNTFTPEIHKCLNFNRIEKETNDNINFYNRMEKARSLREIREKNKSSRLFYYGENSVFQNYCNCQEKKLFHKRNLSSEIKFNNSMSLKKMIKYTKYIHSELMSINFNHNKGLTERGRTNNN